jgi:hypothetical protein
MQTITLTGKIESDGHLKLDIPTLLPEGEVSIVVVIDGVDEIGTPNSLPLNTASSSNSLRVTVTARPLQTNEQNPYSLRNLVARYDDPTEPVAEDDWEVLK